MLLHGVKHPIGLLIIPHCADGEAFQAKFGRVDDSAASSARNRQPDFFNEIDAAAIRNAGDRPSQHVKYVEADDRNIVAHGVILRRAILCR